MFEERVCVLMVLFWLKDYRVVKYGIDLLFMDGGLFLVFEVFKLVGVHVLKLLSVRLDKKLFFLFMDLVFKVVVNN